jgi:flagellar hook-length control protein FliK
MMMGERERGQEESSGADGQGQGEANLFRPRTTGTPESLGRDNQLPLFIDQFTLAKQNQSSSLGDGSPTGTPAAEQLKMTQAFIAEDRSSHPGVPGTAHTVHMDLPTHDSGPLSVRISVTDQMVHTQFTTDRSDLGQFLLARQDQLQQDLSKSGLELGQFQVHVGRHGQQEAPSEGQSRRQGEARGDSPPRQQAEQQDQEQKRQHARSIQALSVFA